MKKISRLISILLIAAMVLAVPVYAYATTTTKSIMTSLTYTHQSKHDGLTITEGIDVSYHNGAVDFKKVKNAGVKYVIMRVGYRGYSSVGNIKGDTKFETYIKDAHAAGLDIGAYFYSQAVTEAEARAEADFVINQLKPYQSYVTMPVAFDYEFAEVSSGRLDSAWNNGTLNKTKMTNNAIAFCERVKQAGYEPMVYANKSFLSEQLDHNKLEQRYQIWMANYTTKTTYAGEYSIWQYASKGSVAGVSSTYVDCNFLYSNGFSVSSLGDYVYTGSAIKPSVTVSANGKTLKLNTDYTLEYKNNTAVGTASVIVTGKGNYADVPKVTRTFTIIPDVVTGLKATDITDTTITVEWTAYSGASGYQVWIKEPSGWKNCGLTKFTHFTFKSLTPAYQHEVSVRAYQTISGTDYFGKYGDYLKVTTGAKVPDVSDDYTGWKAAGGYWYYFINGKAQKNCWQKVNNVWYYFNADCTMHTGWLVDNGKTYYLKSSGAMAQYFNKIGNDWYYFTGSGNMFTGWLVANDKRTFYLEQDGKMVTGFKDIDGKRYYFDSSGVMQTGWITADGKRYYAMNNGSLVRYSQLIKGEHYYFTGQYFMKTGWLKAGNYWYYFSNEGIMQRGWITDNNKRYCLDEDGRMMTGWVDEDGTEHYLTSGGAMATGWCKVDGVWYYFNASGIKATGWRYINKKWYYFKADGVMVRYRQTIDGKQYYFTGDGDMKYGWLKIGSNWYYYGAGGAMVTGKQTIGGKTYTFDDNGVWLG